MREKIEMIVPMTGTGIKDLIAEEVDWDDDYEYLREIPLPPKNTQILCGLIGMIARNKDTLEGFCLMENNYGGYIWKKY